MTIFAVVLHNSGAELDVHQNHGESILTKLAVCDVRYMFYLSIQAFSDLTFEEFADVTESIFKVDPGLLKVFKDPKNLTYFRSLSVRGSLSLLLPSCLS